MKKKIALIVSSLEAGGAEKVMFELANYFSTLNMDVELIVLYGTQSFFENPSPALKISYLQCQSPRLYFAVFELYRYIKKNQAETYYITGTSLNVFWGMLIPFLKTKRFIARESSLPNVMNKLFSTSKSGNRLIRLLLPIAYKNYYRIVCQSAEMQANLVTHFNVKETATLVIPNPIKEVALTTTAFPTAPPYQLVIAGRLAPEKGHLRLFDALQLIKSNVHLSIYGEGRLQTALEAAVKDRNLTSKVTFKGLSKNLSSELPRFHLMLLPSYTEGFPNVLLESFSAGVPVIAFEAGGTAALIKPENGIQLPQTTSAASFAEAIDQALMRTWDKKTIQATCYAQFSMTKIGAAYAALIQ